jgi:hypothetical protein
MTMMKCEQCGRFVDDKPCPFCQSSRVRPLRPGETHAAPATTSPIERHIVEQSERLAQPSSEPPPAAPQPQRAAPPPEPPASPAAPSAAKVIKGLAKFEELIDDGFEAVLICGLGKSGKSEIASAFTRASTIIRGRSQVSTTEAEAATWHSVGGTNPDEVWFEIINTRRKLVFLDPSGEFYRRVSPAERRRLRLPDVVRDDFTFVDKAVKHLAAIVLVVDLTRTLDEMSDAPWRDQEIALEYMLSAIRWLRYDKSASAASLQVTKAIAKSVLNLPRLNVPVLVLFSKADQLPEHTQRNPMSFAKSRLGYLHGVLLTNARRFRFDFVHTMLHYGVNDDRQAEKPCGVLLPLEWLLTDPFRFIPTLPTRWLGGSK